MTSALFDILHLTQKDCLLHTRGTHYFEKLQGLMRKVKCWRLGVKIWVEDVWFGAHSPFSFRALFLGVTSPTSQGPFLPHFCWSGCLRLRTEYTLGMLKNDHSHLLRKMKLKDLENISKIINSIFRKRIGRRKGRNSSKNFTGIFPWVEL